MDFPPELSWAHAVTAEWFVTKFGTPTEPQIAGWPSILAGDWTLISAPTGSGKTLAAFLVCIDTLLRKSIAGHLPATTQVIYVSPLKALSNDIQKNLDGPLAEIQQLALERGHLSMGIRTGVRTGDTLPRERAAMLRHPPHILVTTPESLYILLTAAKSREQLRNVHTVIVDEIHAIADDKRGAHLALSLERLEALVCGENALSSDAFINGLMPPPQRIGLSATQNPIELVANYLTGVHANRRPATIIQIGRLRTMDVAIEVPSAELNSVTSNAMWEEIFDKLAAYTHQHRSTLVFVNTRRLVERIAFALGERLGTENVAAHHGSLSRSLRLDAEQRLKRGDIKILIATASLELGIDIGDIDLVCQIASTRAVAVAVQRIGRAGHWRGAIPKGRLFATTRDDLLEQAALIIKVRAGELDLLEIPPQPIDVLMQQMVAACGAESWDKNSLFNVFRRAYSYRDLSGELFDELISILCNGIESSRGRYGAYLMHDSIHGRLHPRRGARMIAISNGGTIPDTALFNVILQPDEIQIATLDEHFAVDSSPGDVILLGNTSWRIQRIEAGGRVLVEDAHGAPPNVPFWTGEAPQRTGVLCDGVGELREEIATRTKSVSPVYVSPLHPEVAATTAWLMEGCGVCSYGAQQLIAYIVAGRAVLGAVPSKTTIIAERFFDNGGGMQLILHAPFGGRINKAWGLALRKRFCRGFNFELQAAATDNGINISLAEQHSFPLSDVFQFLTETTAKSLLEQASIASPIFKARWRWAAGRSLQLLRCSNGKRIAPQVQRTRSDDLMASVFPQAAACFETIVGDIQIPDHPLVREVMQDVLQEAMDLEGLLSVLRQIKDGTIRCVAVDTPVPSQFAHELLNANPYAFLDDAGLEERRTRAVSLGKGIPASVLETAGKLDRRAIETVRDECWPDIRDENELHDLLMGLVVLPLQMLNASRSRHWPELFAQLALSGRALEVDHGAARCWVATERCSSFKSLYDEKQQGEAQANALKLCVQGWLQICGPVTANHLARSLFVDPDAAFHAFVVMEMQGLLMRGTFENPTASTDHEIEWCERRILQRIHRLTLGALRKKVEPVSPAAYMHWVLGWQHLSPQTQLSGEDGLLEVLSQLAGFEAPAIEWERSLLPSRVADYDPRWLDQLCLSGSVGWGRVSPHPAWSAGEGAAPRRVIPTNAAPITFYLRGSADWLTHALAQKSVEESTLREALTSEALMVRDLLKQRGACFVEDVQRLLSLTKEKAQHALWELAIAGLASADGFDQLRAMMDGRKIAASTSKRNIRSAAGRWCLFSGANDGAKDELEAARRDDAAIESAARMLLMRYGIVFRDLVARESNIPKWGVLLRMFRRLEDRGEIRGGRFVSGFGGEQFSLPEVVDSLRASRHSEPPNGVTIAGADPMNLIGIVIPGERIAAIAGRQFSFSTKPVETSSSTIDALQRRMPRKRSPVATQDIPSRAPDWGESLRLF